MEIYVRLSLISTFFHFFLFSIAISSHTLILPVSQLQTQQLHDDVTNQVTHIEYLMQT